MFLAFVQMCDVFFPTANSEGMLSNGTQYSNSGNSNSIIVEYKYYT